MKTGKSSAGFVVVTTSIVLERTSAAVETVSNFRFFKVQDDQGAVLTNEQLKYSTLV